MKMKKKLDFLMDIAEMAFNNGGDITVELKDSQISSNTFKGAMSAYETTDGGIVLRAYHPTEEEEDE